MLKINTLAKLFFGINSKYFNNLLLKHSGNRLSILAYHRVMNFDKDTYPFDEEIISASPEMFDFQMKFLKNHFNVINFRDLDACLSRGESLPERSVIVTFDDGYSDNYDNVFPILKKYDLTATIFISTGFIDRNETFWFEKVVYWIKYTKVDSFSIFNGKHKFKLRNNRKKTILDVLTLLKTIPDVDRIAAIEEIRDKLNVEIRGSHYSMACPLSWGQVKEMDSFGIEIGSHTISHPILSNLDNEGIYRELSESKNTIEKMLNRDVLCISYPVGEKLHYDERVITASKVCGYKFGVTYNDSVSAFHETMKYELPRIHAENYYNLPLFKGKILLPSIFIR